MFSNSCLPSLFPFFHTSFPPPYLPYSLLPTPYSLIQKMTQNHPNLSNVKIPPGYLNIMGYVDASEVNGPGSRAVVWVQGCLRECPGCFNTESWSFEPNQIISVDGLAEKILSDSRNQGVTFSGGEPFWQAATLANLARRVKAAGLNVMSFSGFTLEQLQSDYAPNGAEDLLGQLDILIDGAYVESLAINSPNSPVSSSNQRVHVFNPALHDQINWASDQIEIHIFKDGSRLITGYRGGLELTADGETREMGETRETRETREIGETRETRE